MHTRWVAGVVPYKGTRNPPTRINTQTHTHNIRGTPRQTQDTCMPYRCWGQCRTKGTGRPYTNTHTAHMHTHTHTEYVTQHTHVTQHTRATHRMHTGGRRSAAATDKTPRHTHAHTHTRTHAGRQTHTICHTRHTYNMHVYHTSGGGVATERDTTATYKHTRTHNLSHTRIICHTRHTPHVSHPPHTQVAGAVPQKGTRRQGIDGLSFREIAEQLRSDIICYL